MRKIWLISRFMTSQPGKQAIAIHIFPNISRNKGNQSMKLGQLVVYNRKNIFLKMLYTKFCGETIPRKFPKKSQLSVAVDE